MNLHQTPVLSLLRSAVSISLEDPTSSAIEIFNDANEAVQAELETNADGLYLLPAGSFSRDNTQNSVPPQNFISDADIVAIFHLRFHNAITPAECQVLKSTLCGQSLREMSNDKNVSYETRRNQMSSLRNKSGLKRQTELVLTMSVLLTSTVHSKSTQQTSVELPAYLNKFYPNNHRIMNPVLSSGRTLKIIDLGPATGRPMIYMYAAFYPFFPLPHQQKVLEELNIRVLIPLRPGFFELPVSVKNAEERLDNFVADTFEFIDVFNLREAPIFSNENGTMAALKLLQAQPNLKKVLLTSLAINHLDKKLGSKITPVINSVFAWRKIVNANPELSMEIVKIFAKKYNTADKTIALYKKWYNRSKRDQSILDELENKDWMFELSKMVSSEMLPGFMLDRVAYTKDIVALIPDGQKNLTLLLSKHDSGRPIKYMQELLANKDIDLHIMGDFSHLSPMFEPKVILSHLFDDPS